MPYRVDDRKLGRHPFELFILYLCVVSSIPTILGLSPEPGSVEDALPAWLATTWSWTLFLGSVITVAGIYWKNRASGLIAEQLGLLVTGVAAIIYVGCALTIVGSAVQQPAGIIAGFGIACLLRAHDLQGTIDKVHREQVRRAER